jgi:N-succinyldiaminopimelate aminotransferase
MNPDLDRLLPYPFERLAALLGGEPVDARARPIALSVGEPQHPTPSIISEALIEHLHGLARYPITRGGEPLRLAIADWLQRRYGLAPGLLDTDRQVLPVNGTREALFAFAQACIDRSRPARVLMPNPFYQIYEGAALLAGARPHYLACTAQTGFLPDLDAVPDAVWQECQLLYLCSPGNPAGAVMSEPLLQKAIDLAERHDFVIAADECYAEIYTDEDLPPPGLLGAAARMGNTEFSRCVVFHSLSKRSNAPGLRSGFVAGDAAILAQFLRYRTYHGCAMPPPTQAASRVAWNDEDHVRYNRALYRAKFDAVLDILAPVMEVERPAGGFYLWPKTPIDDESFTRRLHREQAVTVLPGSYLSRPQDDGTDPGAGRVRMALVQPLEDCVEAAERVRAFVQQL